RAGEYGGGLQRNRRTPQGTGRCHQGFRNAPAVYQNAPGFAYVIGDYMVSRTGTVSGPTNEALIATLNAKGFIAK
ncbi:MAG: hypothetical protein Q4D43_09530, partial [Clostridia bacterium]|nr:hypothetical protein [Clostridia bacterium]